ncbi:hypothetical protein K3720_02830 [Leisingera caerulea]|uniref:hypothetical protein n=1 Tax=Leisingera caerulea TaxID=506591 RepID=UPI0021A4A003|nr:hypothetical protein [Leisingera caerulea]UWQ50360.1 hypothetical protein K3720_02830 [Leisingera caerulea]
MTITQPVATLAAAMLVLLGGVIVHAFQKSLERKEELHREFRARFHEYVLVAKKSEAHIVETKGDTENDVVAEYEAAFFSLRVMAPKSVVEALDRHRIALGHLHDEMDNVDSNFRSVIDEIGSSMSDLEIQVRHALKIGSTTAPYTPTRLED